MSIEVAGQNRAAAVRVADEQRTAMTRSHDPRSYSIMEKLALARNGSYSHLREILRAELIPRLYEYNHKLMSNRAPQRPRPPLHHSTLLQHFLFLCSGLSDF